MMKFFQIVSTNADYDIDRLIRRAFEQRPQGAKESFFSNPFNALFIFKSTINNEEKVNFIFATNYDSNTFYINLKQTTNENMIFEETDYIKELNEYKYSKSIKFKDQNVCVFDEKNGPLLKETINELPEDVMLSIKFKRTDDREILDIENRLIKAEKVLRETNRKVSKEKEYQDYVADRLSKINLLFDVSFELVTKNNDEETKAKLLAYYNIIKDFIRNRYNYAVIKKNKLKKYYIDDFNPNSKMVVDELFNFLYIPKIDDIRVRPGEEPILHYMEEMYYIPADNEFLKYKDDGEYILVGYIKHPFIKDRAIYLPYKTLEQHLMILGQAGSGKTSVLHALISCFIPVVKRSNHGCNFFDPKAVSAERVVNHGLKMEFDGIEVNWKNIHYADLKSGDRVPSINLLYPWPFRDQASITDKTLELFRDVFGDAKTVQVDRNMRNSVGALVNGKPNDCTILDIPKLIIDKGFRNSVIENVHGGMNQSIVDFWKNDPKLSEFSSLDNRLNIFTPPIMKRLFGRKEFDFDFVKYANEGHLLLVNMLDLTNDATTLVVGTMSNTTIEQILNAKKVKGYMTFADEGIQTPVNAFKKMTAMGREPGSHLGFSTQNIKLAKDDFEQALKSNTTTYLIGRHDAESAPSVSKILNGAISASVIQDLPNNTMILRTLNSEMKLINMRIENKPPYDYMPNGQIAEHKNSRHEAISRWWTMKKINELQKEWMHKDDIDKVLFKEKKYDEAFEMIDQTISNVSEDGKVNLF